MNEAAFHPDSTQTVRALTRRERNDPAEAKWYVVQLALSNQPINLDTMPTLDVFLAYRLYSVVGRQGAQHALRLGFFSEEASATVVCDYLRSFFAAPTVVRVSSAEHARFAEPSVAQVRSQTSAAPPANVIQLSAARAPHIKATAASVDPVVTAPSPKPASSTTLTAALTPVDRPAAPSAQSTRSSPTKAKGKAKTLEEELLEEARLMQTSKIQRKQSPQATGSWLSRFVGKPKR